MAEGTTMCDRKESGIRTAGRKPDLKLLCDGVEAAACGDGFRPDL